MCKWFLIYCKPNQDARAQENLVRLGFEVYRPTIQVLHEGSGKSGLRQESLFPRYLFVNADPEQRSIAPISSTFGVACFVKFGSQYALASDALIEEIKVSLEDYSGDATVCNNMQYGDEVWVDGHGFDRMKAIYCNPYGNQRAMILMNILGAEFKMSAPMASLSKVAG